MIVQRINVAIEQINGRIPMAKGRGEEATKQALILPMLHALGYDIWNPQEVCPEYGADFAVKKAGQKEKVDLAVLLEGQPRIYVEVKDVDTSLEGHQGQLARYFSATSSVSLAILSNGDEYRFFTDTGDPNLMDSRPFYVFRVSGTDQRLEILARFHKSVFSPGAIRDFATELNYTADIAGLLREELDLREKDPSERLIRWILGQEKMYEGKVTFNVVDRFRPIVKNALQIVLRDIVRRSVAAMDKEVTAPKGEDEGAAIGAPAAEVKAAESEEGTGIDDAGSSETRQGLTIITTEKELDCFAIVKDEVEKSEFAHALIYSKSHRKEIPIELGYKDTTGYFAIYLNRPSCWVIRLVAETKNPWIGFNVDPEIGSALVPAGFYTRSPHPWSRFRLGFSEPEDLRALKDLILASIKKTIRDRRPSAHMPAGHPSNETADRYDPEF